MTSTESAAINWGHIKLPSWAKEVRPWQEMAAEMTVDLFKSGTKFLICQLPCGFGKGMYAEIVRQALKSYALYVTPNKILQRQVVADFPASRLIMGRSNYPTELYPEYFTLQNQHERITCGDCTGKICNFCSDSCPYTEARNEAEEAPITVSNTAYFLGHMNYSNPKAPSGFKNRGLTIFDEADCLEDDLIDFVSAGLSKYWCKTLEIDPAAPFRKHVATKSEWLCSEVIPKIQDHIRDCQRKVKNPRLSKATVLKLYKDIKLLARAVDTFKIVAANMEEYVYMGDESFPKLEFKPIKIDKFADAYCWRHCKKVLLMSGSIISADQFAADLGIPDGQWEFIDEPSQFAKERRTVRYLPIADMSLKKDIEGESMAKMCKAVIEICEKHSSDKTLIHTVSFARTKSVADALNAHYNGSREIITYYADSSAGMSKDEAVAALRVSKNGILLGASLERGVDLAHDDCRVTIMIKIPFPYLGDKTVSKRYHSPGGRLWYNVCTIRRMMQALSRGVRSSTDWCVSYILDQQFMNIWKSCKHLFPKYWRDALVWDNRDYMADIRNEKVVNEKNG